MDDLDDAQPKNMIPLILGGFAVIMVALIGLIAFLLLGGDGEDDYSGALPLTTETGDTGAAIDSAARIELERLRQQIEALQETIQSMQKDILRLESRRNAPQAPLADGDVPFVRDGPNQILDAYAQVVLIANRRNFNKPRTYATPTFLTQMFGPPRQQLSDNCDPMTNPTLKAMLQTEQVGPVRVTMLRPALDSLAVVFEKIKATDPDLYARINTAGALCVRQIRGTRGRASTHSFGLSLDLNIDGKLDTLGDGRTQLGLTILADFFKNEGWNWGAAFSREDSMHFEVSKEKVMEWRSQGKI
jgi:hypothetical protein